MDWLFNTDKFVSKTYCGDGWSNNLLAAYGISNFVSFLIYQIFPLLIIIYLYPRHLKSVRPALRALVIFVCTCGLTHLMEFFTIWWPIYRLVTVTHVLNMTTSSIGLIMLLIAIKRIRFVPIRADLEIELEQLKDVFKDIQHKANKIAESDGTFAAIQKLQQATNELKHTLINIK